MSRVATALAAVALLASACGQAQVNRHAADGPRAVALQRTPVARPAAGPHPRRELKALAEADHARFVIGPVKSPGGVFAAYSVVPSVYCCRDSHARLHLLRWSGDAWVTDGSLSAVRDGKYWTFPDFSLYSAQVQGGDAEAPLFGGAVNGAGPTAHMLAVRVSGRWRWASFAGCPMGDDCKDAQPQAIIVDPHFPGHRLISLTNNCEPNCAAPSVVYRADWQWSAEQRGFYVAASHRLVRSRAR
jgi:hypothetical protein